MTNEPRSVIEVDNHEAVKIGELEKNTEVIKVVRPKFNNAIFAKATIRVGSDELTRRAEEAGMLTHFHREDGLFGRSLDGSERRSRARPPCIMTDLFDRMGVPRNAGAKPGCDKSASARNRRLGSLDLQGHLAGRKDGSHQHFPGRRPPSPGPEEPRHGLTTLPHPQKCWRDSTGKRLQLTRSTRRHDHSLVTQSKKERGKNKSGLKALAKAIRSCRTQSRDKLSVTTKVLGGVGSSETLAGHAENLEWL